MNQYQAENKEYDIDKIEKEFEDVYIKQKQKGKKSKNILIKIFKGMLVSQNSHQEQFKRLFYSKSLNFLFKIIRIVILEILCRSNNIVVILQIFTGCILFMLDQKVFLTYTFQLVFSLFLQFFIRFAILAYTLRKVEETQVQKYRFLSTIIQQKNKLKKKQVQQLQNGDIILIKKEQTIPCDILLLTYHKKSKLSDSCHVFNYSQKEELVLQYKQGLKKLQPKDLIQSNEQEMKQYIQDLSFSIDIQNYDNQSEDFTGYLQMHKDPKKEQITKQNILYQNSILKQKWAIGLVIKQSQDIQIKIQRKSQIERKFDKYQLQYTLFLLFFVFSYYTLIIKLISQEEYMIYSQFFVTILFNLPLFVNETFYILNFVCSQKIQKHSQQIEMQKQAQDIQQYRKSYRDIIKTKKTSVQVKNKVTLQSNQSQSMLKKRMYIKKQNPIIFKNFDNIQNIANLGSIILSKNQMIQEGSQIVKSISNQICFNYISYSDEIPEKYVETTNQYIKKSEDLSQNDTVRDKRISKPQINIIKPIQFKQDSIQNSIESIQVNQLTPQNQELSTQKQNLLGIQKSKDSLSCQRQQTQNFFNESFLVLPQYRQSNNQIFHKKKIKLHKGLNNEFIVSKIQNIHEFLLNFLIVINYECIYLHQKDDYRSDDPDDNSIIEFLKLFNIKIKDLKFSRKSNSYNIYIKQNNLNYKFKIYYSEKNYELTTHKIIVYDYQDLKIKFFLRTNKYLINANFQNKADVIYKLERIQESNLEVHLKSVYIFQSQMDEDQTKIFIDLYLKKIKHQTQAKEFLEQTLKDQEDQLVFRFCLGLKEQHNEKNIQFFNKIFQAGIRMCFLTSDTEQFVKTVQQKLMVQGAVLIKFDFLNQEEGCLFFKDQFQKIEPTLQSIISGTSSIKQKIKLFQQHKRLVEHKRFVLLLSGPVLDIIFQNPYLYYNFKFFVAFSCQIYCYKIQPEQKVILAEILQDLEKTKSLMAIGQVDKDHELLNTSDVSVQFEEIDIGIFADLYVNSLEVLEYLIFNLVQPLFFASLKILDSFIYINSYYVIQFVLIHKIFSSFEFSIIQKNFLQLIYSIVYLMIECQTFQFKYKKENMLYYNQNQEYVKRCYKKYLIIVFEGSIHSFFNFTIIWGLLYFVEDISKKYNNGTIQFILQIINNISIALRLQNLKLNRQSLFLFFVFQTIQVVFAFLSFYIYYSNIQIYIFREVMIYVTILANIVVLLIVKRFFQKLRQRLSFRNFWREDQQLDYNSEELQNDYLSSGNENNKLNQLFIYKIFKLKQFMDPFLLSKIYPFSLLQKKDTLSTVLIQFKDKFLRKTYIYLEIIKNQKSRNKNLLQYLFLIMLIIINQFMLKNNEYIFEHVIVFLFYFYYYLYFTYFSPETKVYQKIKVFYYFSEFLVFINIFLGKNNFSLYHLAQIIFIQYILEFEVFEFLAMQLFKVVVVVVFFLYRYNRQDFMSNLYSKNLLLHNIAFITIFTLLKLYYTKIKKQSMLYKFRLLRKKNQNNDLLTFLMPQFILKKLSFNLEQTYLAEDAGMVSVLFLYIYDFNDILNAYQDDIINLLDQIYKDFDILCQKHGVQKIETVGCSYVAACGGQVGEDFLKPQLKAKDPTKRIFDLALSIMNIINNYKDHNGNKMRLKIGINKGKCLMGVIGYHKPQFSLIGDTINTTSRLCTTGKPGNIMVSESVYDIIKEYSYGKKIEFKKVVTYMKGKGDQNVYHVFRKQKSLKKIVKQVISKQKQNLVNSEGRGQRIKKRGKTIKEITPLNLQNNLSAFTNEKDQIKNQIRVKSNLKLGDDYKIFQQIESQKDVSQCSQLFQSSENNEEQEFFNKNLNEEEKKFQFEPINKISCYNNKVYNGFVNAYQDHLDSSKLYINYIINIFCLGCEIFTFIILLFDGIQNNDKFYIIFNSFKIIKVVWIILNLLWPQKFTNIKNQNVLLVIFSINAFFNFILDYFTLKTRNIQAYYSNQFHKLMIYIVILTQQQFKKYCILWTIH